MRYVLEALRICFGRYNSMETAKIDTVRVFERILEQATKAYELTFNINDNISGILPKLKLEKSLSGQ